MFYFIIYKKKVHNYTMNTVKALHCKLRKLTGIILHVHTFCILFTQLNLLEYAGNISCVSNYIIRRAPDFVSARLQICARKYIVLRKVHFCVSKKIYLLTQHIQSRFRNFY